MHLEAPTSDRLTRLIRSAVHTFEQQLYEATLARLPEATQAALLVTPEIVALQESDALDPASPGGEAVPLSEDQVLPNIPLNTSAPSDARTIDIL